MWLEVVRRGGHCVAAGGGGIDREFECRLGGCCMRSCGLSKVHVWAGRTGAGPRRGRRGGSVRGLRGREGRGKWTGPQEGRQVGRRGGAGGRAHAAGAPPPGRHVGWCVGVKRCTGFSRSRLSSATGGRSRALALAERSGGERSGGEPGPAGLGSPAPRARTRPEHKLLPPQKPPSMHPWRLSRTPPRTGLSSLQPGPAPQAGAWPFSHRDPS
jgi:hypothetical protein